MWTGYAGRGLIATIASADTFVLFLFATCEALDVSIHAVQSLSTKVISYCDVWTYTIKAER